LQIIKAKKIKVHGIVQGVGFRPRVHELAHMNHLRGHVFNTSGDVTITVEGAESDIHAFVDQIRSSPPPQSRIESISIEDAPVEGFKDFQIRKSVILENEYQLISPDIATCPLCAQEILDPADRRYGYPFTNCTNCGPRFTIIESMPYDRNNTTMRKFTMCPQCREDYENPMDRRFHAQPNACPKCGPKLSLMDSNGKDVSSDDPLALSADLLRAGRIIAIKGLGGFLLACDAGNDQAVSLLRDRKRRFKPFAVMMASIDEIENHCYVSEAEKNLLISSQAPIVLLRRRPSSILSDLTAPNTTYLGVMLPYTPLHHLLLKTILIPLVMTSGNISEEPIAADNQEAFQRLAGIADYFLIHDRDICSSYDDSVAMVINDRPQVVRRARGFAPYPIRLQFNSSKVLACGAEVKGSFCLTQENHAFLSQHIGDMENLETLEHFKKTVSLYQRLFHIVPDIIAYDMHPDYLSTRYAVDLINASGLRGVPVQHHHAHIVSCMADNGVTEPVIGVALDGTGYGEDGAIWGGEFLIADYSGFQRVAHFEYVPMPGGKAAIEKPYRMALSYLFKVFGDRVFELDLPFLIKIEKEELTLIKQQIESRINTPLTSSCGRLFDAVSATLNIRAESDYEGQAAVELESIADINVDKSYAFEVMEEKIISFDRMFRDIVEDTRNNVATSIIAGRFHRTIADVILKLSRAIGREKNMNKVALSGGVFQNRLLLELTIKKLEAEGMTVLVHHEVPTNDGGISLGQAVTANHSIKGR
jgi:hydrogenase maturation protein HypF